MADLISNQSKPPFLRVRTMRLWAGRHFYAMFAGGFVGLGLGTLILSHLQWTGDKAPALVGVCIVLTALIAFWLCTRSPRIRAIQASDGGLVFESRDGRTDEVPYADLSLYIPHVESLFTLLPGKSFAVDFLINDRFIRVYLSAPMRGELYRYIEQKSPQTAILTPAGSIELPVPPDSYFSGWQHDSELLIRRLYRYMRKQAFVTALLMSVVFLGLVAFQVLAFVYIGEQAIRGMLILLIAVAAVLAVGGWWGVWGSILDCRLFLAEVWEACSLDSSQIKTNAGRLRLTIETGPPDEISLVTKWCSVLGVLLSCVPFVGLIFATRALYYTWERKSFWYTLAWYDLILSIVVGFCSGFLIGSALFGYESALDDF